jgi:hypothetical protein
MWDCKHHTRLEVVVISYYSIVWSFLYHEHDQDAMTMTLASSCSTNSHESSHEISFIHENVTKIHHIPHNIKIRWRANWWHHWSKVEGSSHLFGWKLKTTSGSMAAMTTVILQGQLGFSFHLKTSMRLPARRRLSGRLWGCQVSVACFGHHVDKCQDFQFLACLRQCTVAAFRFSIRNLPWLQLRV